MTMKEIIKNIERQLEDIKKFKEPMDEASWGYEEGVLLSGNEAKAVIEQLKKVEVP